MSSFDEFIRSWKKRCHESSRPDFDESEAQKEIKKKNFEKSEQECKYDEEKFLAEQIQEETSEETHRNSEILDTLMNTNENRIFTGPHMVLDSLGTPQLNEREFYMDEPKVLSRHKKDARRHKVENPEKFENLKNLWQSRYMGW